MILAEIMVKKTETLKGRGMVIKKNRKIVDTWEIEH